ncbi:MAG TPA: metallophosphoesterase family protein [Vicinamibacterales bacterium]|nr:metallophosphoesterase family protein [Vicinamibacterales bacterium]
MRLAVLNDIHGNLPALDAVLGDVDRAGVDAVVCGGDVIVGPQSREVLDRLSALSMPVHYVYGNCETAVLEQLAGRKPPAVPDAFLPTIVWTAAQVGPQYGEALRAWPKTLRLGVDGIGDVVFCHGTPRDENEIFTRLTPEERLRPLFDPLEAALVVCGHTHVQFDRQVGATRVVNAGSVGMPWGRAGADWLIVGPRVELRRTHYDVAAAAAAVEAAGYPDANGFFVRSVLTPPAADEMERAFEQASLRSAP